MDTMGREHQEKINHPRLWMGLKIIAGSAFVGIVILAALLLLSISQSPTGQLLGGAASWLLATNTVQATWYVTRAAGITGYLLLWLSTAWGLAVTNRILDGKLHGSFTYDFHQFISLLSIGFIILHVVVLMFDQYLPFSVAQILIPFISDYRPLWVGIGILSMYIILLVTVTFYLRDRIGTKTFRSIHVLSLLSFLGAAAHGLFAGTDSPLISVQLMYLVTFLSVVFLMVYWLIALAIKRQRVVHQ